jgi:phenylacetate-CoA ligase
MHSAFAEALKGIDAADINTRAALAKLPVMRKYELLEQQKASRAAGGSVFGGFSAVAFGKAHAACVCQPRSDL